MAIHRLDYIKLIGNSKGKKLLDMLPDRLLQLWFDDYRRSYPRSQMTEVTLDANGASYTYLFDLVRQRNIAAVGEPAFVKHKRDASRMTGHPLPDGPDYHRGHLMAHSIGGGTDINLVPQLGRVNIGQFRVIERIVRKLAEEHVRCVYFVRTIYPPYGNDGRTNQTQLPDRIEQCVIEGSGGMMYDLHGNV